MWAVFSLGERLRHIGHLDLMRALQRALRRSGLPVSFSQGFNPHILLSLAAPLSVGMAGEREVMEVPLSDAVTPGAFAAALNAALPAEIRCLECRPKPDDAPAPMAALFAAQYRARFEQDAPLLADAARRFMALAGYEAVKRTKKGDKAFDLRPLVYNLVVRENELLMTLALRESGTAKPEIVLNALAALSGAALPPARVTRTALLAESFAPLENA